MTTTTLRFETESCSRCGGSGQYSFCTMYGSTCFKCGGSKRQYTRAGKVAMAAWHAHRDEATRVDATDVLPGTVLMLEVGGSPFKVVKPRTVAVESVSWTLDQESIYVRAKNCSFGVARQTGTFRRPPTEALMRAWHAEFLAASPRRKNHGVTLTIA